MIDPQRDLVLHLRGHADLAGVLAQFTRTGLDQRAVFRTEAPADWKPGAVPYAIVDPMQEGPRSFGSFSARTPMIDVPVRLFSLIRDEGDGTLAEAAMVVRRLILREGLTLTGGVLNDIDCGIPEDTPTSGPSVGGRRLLVRMLITETG